MRLEKKLNTGHVVGNSPHFNKYNIWDMWLVSDTHFNHYPKTWDWPGRKEGWEERIFTQWNSRIKVDDPVLHLGDFAFGNKEEIFLTKVKLNGKIFLLKGNHDRHGDKWYQDLDITLIKKSFFIDTDDESFIFSHRPMRDKKGYNLKNVLNIHGHVHEKCWYMEKNYVNLSVEQTDFAPIKFRDLIHNWRLHNLKNEV